jgi:hypothetical protein
MRNYRFKKCWFHCDDQAKHCQTVFVGGMTLAATPEPALEYAATAAVLGYRGDLWCCCWEHEILHTVCCEAYGFDRSPTLYYAACKANGLKLPRSRKYDRLQEERLILDTQKFLQTGAVTPAVLQMADQAFRCKISHLPDMISLAIVNAYYAA